MPDTDIQTPQASPAAPPPQDPIAALRQGSSEPNPLWELQGRSQDAEGPGGVHPPAAWSPSGATVGQDLGTWGNLGETMRKGEEAAQLQFKRNEEAIARRQEAHDYLSRTGGPLSLAQAQLQIPTPAPPPLQKVAPPPQALTQQDGKNMVAFASAMALFGAIGSRFARIPAEAAMNAFSGAIKGYQQGNQTQFENSYKEWDANTKAAIENNKNLIERYRQVLENKNLDISHMKTAFEIEALKAQDQVGIDVAKSESAQHMAAYYNALGNMQIKAEEAHAKLQKQGGGASPEGLYKQAEQYVAQGGVGFGVKQLNQPGMQDAIDRVLADKNMGRGDLAVRRVQYTSNIAQGRVLGTRAGNIEVSAEELRSLAPLALDANSRLARSEFVPLNQLQQQGQRMTSNPDYIALNAYTQGVITAYSATMSRSGANTVHAQQRAEHVINTAMGEKGYQTAIETLVHEVDAVERAPENARKRLAQSILGEFGGGAPAAGGQGTQSAPAGKPPVSGAQIAPDGNWYVKDPDRPGKYLKVNQ
jgi:hypothetical protein